MSETSSPVNEDDLQAWVDGRLPPARLALIEQYLARNPEQAARVTAYREHRNQLRAWLAPKAAEPVPRRLRVAWLLTQRRAERLRVLRTVAVGLVLLLLGGAAGWLGRGFVASEQSSPSARLTADAVQAFRTFVSEVRHPVEVPASQEAHLITWLSNRLGHRLSVPDLSRMGFHLMGGRLLPGERVPAAQFMYEDDRGVRLALYMRAGPGNTGAGFQIIERDGVTGFRWYEGGFGYCVLAETARARLLQVAESVFQQASPPQDGQRK